MFIRTNTGLRINLRHVQTIEIGHPDNDGLIACVLAFRDGTKLSAKLSAGEIYRIDNGG